MIGHSSQFWFTIIGSFYQYGVGTVIDNQMAFKLFGLASNERIYMKNTSSNLSLRKFCNINEEIRIIRLTHMYIDGKGLGVEKMKKRHLNNETLLHALMLFSVIFMDEEYQKMKLKGVGVDKIESFKWYFKGVKKGYPRSQHNLGLLYEYAFEWYKKAAENDHVKSQHAIGHFCEGHGARKDVIKAIYWLDKTKENGNAIANRLLEEANIYRTLLISLLSPLRQKHLKH
ncbi:hypothetical protein Glove_350g104 [Diversispora epigaea]|uniref:Uncharacterized protein n=1 Tax=Diversispora epigaea TaxID=1348612 RepID=A0A397HH42_9GLOM|nr:hypothetical protein Glove_350g104 [Diversispora epigaea]